MEMNEHKYKFSLKEWLSAAMQQNNEDLTPQIDVKLTSNRSQSGRLSSQHPFVMGSGVYLWQCMQIGTGIVIQCKF